MYNHQLYLLYWTVNSVVLYFAAMFFPIALSLGGGRFVPIEAAIYSGFWMTFVVWIMWDFMIAKRVNLEPEYVGFIFFLLINIVGVWTVARFTHYSGIQITNFAWVCILAVCANILQRIVRSILVSKPKGYKGY